MNIRRISSLCLLVAFGLVASLGWGEDPYTVRVMYFGDATDEAQRDVSAAISKITMDKINAKVEVVRIGFGSYVNQLNLALASGEKLDVFCTLGNDISKLANSGQVVPMNSYLANEGKDIRAGFSPFDFACASVGSKIYGFPASKETATNYGFIMLKKIADEIGVTSSNTVYTLDQLESILKKAKKAHPEMYPVGTDFQRMYMPSVMDNLGSHVDIDDGSLGVLENSSKSSTQVANWYATDTYRKFVETSYRWAHEGLVMPDAVTNTQSRLDLMRAGKVMGGFSGLNPGNVENLENQLGQKVIRLPMTPVFSVTGHVSGILWCIAQNSKNPSKAMSFLDLAYSNPQIADLLLNGLEGQHYVVAKGVATLPEGVTTEKANATWMRLNWAMPNGAIAHRFDFEDPQFWSVLAAYNKSAIQSPAKGFQFDGAKVTKETSACINVVSKYSVALLDGVTDPKVSLPKFLSELKTAGIDTIIKEKQTQLNAWLKEKKN